MEIDKQLLERYVRGLTSPRETEAVERWLTSGKAEDSLPPVENEEEHITAAWNRLSEQVATGGDARQQAASDRMRIAASWIFRGRMAAFLVMGSTFLWFLLKDRETGRAVPTKSHIAFTTIRTANGERKTHTLPDGSLVHLNAGSTITFPEFFLVTDTLRLIEFSGEAFFEVARNPDMPFVVKTEGASVRVLGTRFNLREYPGETTSTVAVEEGKVRLSNPGMTSDVVLAGGQLGTIDGKGNARMKNVYAAKYTAWKNDKLVFDNQSLSAVVPELERWYGIEVSIRNGLWGSNRYTGSFSRKPLKEVLEELSYAIGFSYSITGKKVLIY